MPAHAEKVRHWPGPQPISGDSLILRDLLVQHSATAPGTPLLRDCHGYRDRQRGERGFFVKLLDEYRLRRFFPSGHDSVRTTREYPIQTIGWAITMAVSVGRHLIQSH